MTADNELEQYVNRFYEEAAARDATVLPMQFSLRFKGVSDSCSKGEVCVDDGKWVLMSELEREITVFRLLAPLLLNKKLPMIGTQPSIFYELYREGILDDLFRL